MTNPPAAAPIALITSDWHMMDHAWTNRKNLSGDAECVLNQVVETAATRRLPIIAAGDLFDSRYPPKMILVRTMRLLRGLHGCYIMGNHDRTEIPWMKLVAPDWIDLGVGRADLPLSPPPVPEVRTGTPRLPPLFETGKRWHVHGIDYCLFPSRLQAELDRLEERIDPEDGFANVLVLHQQSEAQVPVGDCELADRMIPDVFDLVVLGHHHRPESFSLLTRSGRSVSCLSPGGFHLKKINEEPRKQLYTLFADGSVDSDPLVTRRVITLDLNGGTQREILEKTERILASIRTAKVRRPPEIERPILSVEMNGETFSGAERLLEEIFGETVHLFVKRDGEEDDGINVGQYDDIDVERYTEIGVRYARHIFPNCEPDPEVREIVETMLTREASEANYLAMKETFLSRHKVVPGQAG